MSEPLGGLDLRRWPPRADDVLQAWDGADRYLLADLAERAPDGPVLVVDDAFGALGCNLGTRARAWGDSEIARLALEDNATRNRLEAIPWTPMTEPPPGDGVVAVLGRLPRSLRRLQYLLSVLAPTLAPGTPVVFGAKSKYVQKSAGAAFEAAIGAASSTRAAHRARLVVAIRDDRVPPPAGAPGVFGEGAMDRGTALLLEALGELPEPTDVIDLGCGSGDLGVAAAKAWPAASLLGCDESHLAVDVARARFAEAFPGRAARFVPQNVLAGTPDGTADLVLCNPPFHQGQTITRRVAAHMFVESARVLRPGGRLVVVGNRHLGYHIRLPRHFAHVRVLRSSKAFVVLEARR